MKKITPVLTLFAFLGAGVYSFTSAQNVGINTSGAIPSVNAILDLNTGNAGHNLGLIIPNVTLGASLATFNPPMANAPTFGDRGMMVYNSNAANQPIGYYYWNGATWVSVSGAGVTVTAANDGTSLNGTTVILGNAFGGGAGQLTQNTEIPLNGFNLTFSRAGGSGNIGIDLNAGTSAAQALEIGRNSNTIRVNGLKNGSNFFNNNGSAPLQSYLMFVDNNGDMNSMAAGVTNDVLTWTAGGPAWQPGAGATANNGLTVVGGNIQLGGANPLLANTSIISAGNNLAFTGTGIFQLGQGSNSTGTLQFLNSTNNRNVSISAGVTTGSYTLILPLAQGAAGTVLTNNGAGVLSWNAAGGVAANNGLTVVGGNVQLGGANPLLANTNINTAGFNLGITGGGELQLGAASTSTGEVDFYNTASALGIGVKAAATTTTYTLALPVAPPASNGQVLASSVGGTMSWATIPAGGPGILIGILYITSTTGTVSFAAGTTSVLVRAIGGGGAGGGVKNIGGCGTTADNAGGGGGAGGYCEGFVSGLGPGSTYQINIGAGGIGVATCGAVSGGATVVTITGPNTVFTANGGAGGPSYETGAAGSYPGGAGGTAVGGNLNITGSTGGYASISTTGTDGVFAGCGGNSSFGSGGSSVYTRDHLMIPGVNATAPGAGGGGAAIAQAVANDAAKGGNGSAGIVIIYEYQ